jgi:hypothetical protein
LLAAPRLQRSSSELLCLRPSLFQPFVRNPQRTRGIFLDPDLPSRCLHIGKHASGPKHRQWPEGFEFAACDTCNNGTRDDDLLIAMLARLDPFQNRGDFDGKTAGLMARAHKRFPRLFGKMLTVDPDGLWLAARSLLYCWWASEYQESNPFTAP